LNNAECADITDLSDEALPVSSYGRRFVESEACGVSNDDAKLENAGN
jgi:hypothetical protein